MTTPPQPGVETPADISQYFDRLWPLLRSLTGDGVRRTLDILDELVPLERIEVPTGTKVLDWTVPEEWVVREAYVIAPDGTRILDVAENNLHLLNYSIPFHGTVPKHDFVEHCYSLPEMPDAIPYVTSYYSPRWGFCISHNDLVKLPDGDYEIVIDTEMIDGSLTIGEAVLPGEEEGEILLSANTCHPSLANNELSGPLVTAFLYRRLAARRRRFTYRFVFLPETIGSVSFLSMRGQHLAEKLVAGYVVTCLGGDCEFTYKRSRQHDSIADRVALHVLARADVQYKVLDFFPDAGSDERQYCSPGYNLPVGSLMRMMYGEYEAYHTSLDTKDVLSFDAMHETIDVYMRMFDALEANATYVNRLPHGEPQLGKRGLYPTLGTRYVPSPSATMWTLNYSDGEHDLLDIAERSGHDLATLADAAEACCAADLLERIE